MRLKKIAIYSLSLLGALGTGLQNCMAVAAFIPGLMSTSFAITRTGLGIIHGISVVMGGLCSTLVNFCINIELLEDFYQRVTQKPIPALSGWQRFQYWAGSGVFVITGILFGLTAIAFGPAGPFAAMSITAGIFLSIIMMIQELETWLSSFDNLEESNQKSFKEIFWQWKHSLTPGKIAGIVISLGNVFALSLLFTIGLMSFFIGVGVPAMSALIAGFCIAFTGGAFTEFYFYHLFLSNFCNKFDEKWEKIWQTPYPVMGMMAGSTNAIVNGVLAYTGIMMMIGFLAMAHVAAPPLGLFIATAVIASSFSGGASFILGMDFWIRNSQKITDYVTGKMNSENKTSNVNIKDERIVVTSLNNKKYKKVLSLFFNTWKNPAKNNSTINYINFKKLTPGI